ncbi:MAG: Gfo/Idh/MocA family oxidoreductase [Acidimicrobiia bacterium]|nr:Gfo/Idh/MocA family oxidoreductase [Acidimicrobiia bacterium]
MDDQLSEPPHLAWGIIGTGGIASAFAAAIVEHGSSVAGVASRAVDRAEAFLDREGIDGLAGTVETLVASKPDAVYVGSSHHNHLDDALACIEAGIPVLCEKPLTPDLPTTDRMIDAARSARVFLMEAMWMRFQPAWILLERLIADGLIGEVRTIHADFGIVANDDPRRRWFDPAQAGGSLLDVGIYPVTFAQLVAGPPMEVFSTRTSTETGVDAQYAIALKHEAGVLSLLGSSFVSDTDLTATVSGSLGRLHVTAPFHHSSRIEHWKRRELAGSWEVAYEGSGYVFEVAEVERCLAAGLTESPRHPLADTRAVMATLDTLQREG